MWRLYGVVVVAMYNLRTLVRLTQLKFVRQRKALTQQQLAEKSGVNRVTIARLEGGKDQPFPTTVRKLADALGVDPEDLMIAESQSRSVAVAEDDAKGHLSRAEPVLQVPDVPAGPIRIESGSPVLVASSTVLVEGSLNDRLLVKNPHEVSALLGEQPHLAPLVREAAEQVLNFFPDARLSLEQITDPEYGDGEELLLGVSTELPDDEASAALRRFDQEWWLHHVQRARGLLCIDLR